MVKLLFVRHAEKQKGLVNNYDVAILESEPERASVKFDQYIKQYNSFPDKILVSPYLRTRQTADVLTKLTNQQYEIDNRFSNYLSTRKHFDISHFQVETFQAGVIPPETVYSFRKRILTALQDIIENSCQDEVIWIITHRFIIGHLAKQLDNKYHSCKPLEGILIEDNLITYLE